MTDERRKDAVFGVEVGGELLYDTLSPNPSRAMRVYKKLKRPVPEELHLMQYRMCRARIPGDVRGVFREAMMKKGPYIGPMR
jgi:hypothetical protein